MIYTKKVFLNDSAYESGYIISSVHTPKKIKEFDDKWTEFAASLKIADCHEDVTLDFSYKKPKQFKKRLKKIDLLIQELQNFKEEMIKQSEYYEKHYVKGED